MKEVIGMKYFYRLTQALIVLGFAGTAVFLLLAPDTVPAHYNAAMEVTRMGSKFEYAVFPFISAGMGAAFLLLAKQVRTRKLEGGALAEKIFLVTAVGEVLLFHGISVFFMCLALS